MQAAPKVEPEKPWPGRRGILSVCALIALGFAAGSPVSQQEFGFFSDGTAWQEGSDDGNERSLS
jgi:hypothetical protein